jgi:nucleoside-diphosphate-sugar epimerase
MVLAKVLHGKRALVPAKLDLPHSWTYIPDVAHALITLAGDERAWGRPWHVPTQPAVSVREAATRACAIGGAPPPRLSEMPGAVLWAGGLFNPLVRGFREMAYQFQRPFVLDSSATEATFGLRATPWDEALAAVVGRLRSADQVAA